MNPIPGYQITNIVYESANSLVYRAIREKDDLPVVLKILKEDYPTPSELTRYKQEYEITHSLNLENVIKAYDLQRYQNSLVMLLEDFGGESLKIWISQQKFSLEEALTIAIKTAESLGAIHAAGIIHKDVNPSNIVYNPQAGQLKVIDFGISTALSRENPEARNPQFLEGTLAYISPEQTGRMNRVIDYRTDFYSLGVTLYELLTDHLPFEVTNPMELVHCHLAMRPLSPCKRSSKIPKIVSKIVMKLLAKTAEERYQSSWGLKADLENCLNQLQTTHQVSDFPLGQQDSSDKFQIPQKLYGREEEVTQLLNAFLRVSQGTTEIVFVTGYSGIGKSALVNEINKPIVQQRGYFISGKFDQLQRNIPYTSLVQAFQELIRQLLTESQESLKIWRKKLLSALKNNGQVIIDVIPEVEFITGKQPVVAQLGATESQNRFNLVFQKFVDVFAKKEHPLVIFLDDLQWADLASLNLIQLLLNNTDGQCLLMIGAYRDNEVEPTHPLILTLEKLQSADIRVNQITLDALSIDHISQLIADTLHASIEVSKPLAQLMLTKTGGNPFFLAQLLQSLCTENLLRFDFYTRKWKWDIEQIQTVGITNNVIELMINRIEKLDESTQNVLKLAACIGNRFDLEVLSIVNSKPLSDTALDLWSALQEGLILPLSDDYKVPMLWNQEADFEHSEVPFFNPRYASFIPYKFLHDRIQQAAYALIPQDKKKDIHLKIGRLLLQNTEAEELEEKIFDIVNQLNIGSELIVSQSEKNDLAKLNLTAGKKAKASTAYESALKYLRCGLNLLENGSWEQDYELTLSLHVEAVEVEALNTNFEAADKLADSVIDRVDDLLDQVKIYKIKIQSYLSKFQYTTAIDTALHVLRKLGETVPQKPSKLRILNQHFQVLWLLGHQPIEDLVDLPEMTNPYKSEAVGILLSIASAAYVINPLLFNLITLNVVILFLKYGNSPLAPGGYVIYGMYLCAETGDFDSGYQFAQLSLKLLEKANSQQMTAMTLHVYNSQIKHWKDDAKGSLELTLEAIQVGIENGDVEYGCYAILTYCTYLFLTEQSLERVELESKKYIKMASKLKQEHSAYFVKIGRQLSLNLMDQSDDKFKLVGDALREDECLPIFISTNNKTLLDWFYIGKSMLLYLLKSYDEAAKMAKFSEEYLVPVHAGAMWGPLQNFYHSLICLALCKSTDRAKQNQLLKKVFKNQRRMKKWAGSSPINYQHKYELVEAEKARVLQRSSRAMDFYERAIRGAKEHGYIQEEAVAYERAAEFYLSIGREEISSLYLKNAHHCYSRWGAVAKVKDLESEYPQILGGATSLARGKRTTTISTTANSSTAALDLSTVLKASQALASEIALDKLLEKLIKIVIENAGAQRGFLILSKDGNWVIEAEGTVNSDEVRVLESLPIDVVDTDSQTSVLSTSIANYVIRTQENIVLNDAVHEGKFIRDPYVVSTLPKSILCTPLLNQGQLQGILYLENNLTTGAFTPDRLEILSVLSAQAAISLQNAQLYVELGKSNRTLEQKVLERTQELSQTVKVLEATQAELQFENELLRKSESSVEFDYQVGGSLPIDDPTYVVRSADRELYRSLQRGEFCYILNPRQMGKSSLIVRMMQHLQSQNYACAVIDLTTIGTSNITLEQWYAGVINNLSNSFELYNTFDLSSWWRAHGTLSPMQRLGLFVETVLLVAIKKPIVIFIDEIDSVLGLNFDLDDFFILIRSYYNQRNFNPAYQRLTFVFSGVATPADLVTDPKKTPFNIGQLIQLEGFKDHEAQPLLRGLSDKVSAPQVILKEVLSWTNGQPFLTQKLCKLIRNDSSSIPTGSEVAWVEQIVQAKIIENWESQDEPQHLRTIRDRLLNNQQLSRSLLSLYQHILQQGEIPLDDSFEQRELLLSGLVVKQRSILQEDTLVLTAYNRIYQAVFSQHWVEQALVTNR